jgi:hypothetical protein
MAYTGKTLHEVDPPSTLLVVIFQEHFRGFVGETALRSR